MRLSAWLPRLGASVLLVIMALPARPAGATTRLDSIIVAYPEAPASLDPQVAYDGPSEAVLSPLYETLVRMKGSSLTEVEGMLATHWTSNTQKTVWTFYLRRGVFFHDGTPFDAAAVKFTIQRLFGINQAPVFLLGQFMTARGVRVLDPYTIQFHLTVPAPHLLLALASEYGNWIVSPTAVKAHTVHGDWGQKWLSTHDAGTGPYVLGQYTPNQGVTFVKFPRYWRGWTGYHASRVIVTFVAQDATRSELIEKGDADISQLFTPEDLVAMQKNPNLAVDTSYRLENISLVPTEDGPFASAQARLALAYAFDYEGYIKGLMRGFARQAQGPLVRGSDGQDSRLPFFHTDLARARQLFKQAGFKPGTTITVWYQTDDPWRTAAAEIIQGQLSQLGFNVVLQQRDSTTYFSVMFSNAPAKQRPNLWVSGWAPDYNDAIDWLTPIYHSKDAAGDGAANAGMYHNAQVDTLLAQAATTLDVKTRQRLLDRLQTILTITDPAAVFIADKPNSTVYQRSLHGYYYNAAYNVSYDYYAMWK